MAIRNRFHIGLDFISHIIFPRGCSSQAKALYSECSLALADQHQQVLSSLISHMLIRPFRQCGEGKTSGFFERDDPAIWLDWRVLELLPSTPRRVPESPGVSPGLSKGRCITGALSVKKTSELTDNSRLWRRIVNKKKYCSPGRYPRPGLGAIWSSGTCPLQGAGTRSIPNHPMILWNLVTEQWGRRKPLVQTEMT